MKIAIFTAAIYFLASAAVPVSAQNNIRQLGIALHNYHDSTTSVNKEVAAITFSGPADSDVQLFEASVPATSAAECLATTSASNFTPVPAERIGRSYDNGRWVIVVATDAASFGRCHLFVGRSSVDTNDFSFWRSNFGRTSLIEGPETKIKQDEEALRRQTSAPIYRIGRLFPE